MSIPRNPESDLQVLEHLRHRFRSNATRTCYASDWLTETRMHGAVMRAFLYELIEHNLALRGDEDDGRGGRVMTECHLPSIYQGLPS